MARKKVIKRCPKGHEMEALWLRCPKCTGGKPGLKAGRSFEDVTMFAAPDDEGANETVIVSPSVSRTGSIAPRPERAGGHPAQPGPARPAPPPPPPPPPAPAHPAWAGPPAAPTPAAPAHPAWAGPPAAPTPAAPAHPAWAGPPAAPTPPPPAAPAHPAWAGPPAEPVVAPAPPPAAVAPPPPPPPPPAAPPPRPAAVPFTLPASGDMVIPRTDPTPSEAPIRSRAKLECTSGPLSGRMFMLAPGVYRIGKAPRTLPDSKTIVVPNDKWMSKDHAVVIVEGPEVVLTDPGSTNGSFVNGEKISRAVLKSGDEVRLGESIFRFTLVGT